MPYEIVIGDISDLSFHVDVIVTLAHPTPGEVGYGVDRAIYRRVGDQLKEDRRRMGPFECGGMIIISSYGLNAERLLHVLVPFYQNGEQGEQEALRKCYDQVLKTAYDYKYKSIAFPLMSSGNYGFAIRDAYRIAMHAFHEFCETHDMNVYFLTRQRSITAKCSACTSKSIRHRLCLPREKQKNIHAHDRKHTDWFENPMNSVHRQQKESTISSGKLQNRISLMFCASLWLTRQHAWIAAKEVFANRLI